jgi:hypothetical protein
MIEKLYSGHHCFCGATDGTQGLTHARQATYQSHTPALIIIFECR